MGDGTTTQHLTPVNVSGLTSGVTSVVAGARHTCAMMSSGAVKCWGDNTYGQLGDGTTTQRNTPVQVSGLTSGVVMLRATSTHNCIMTSSNGLKCWGDNAYGQLGDGTTTNRSTPVNVTGLTSGVVRVGTGNQFSCARTSAGLAKCWGLNNAGQLGDGTQINRLSPVIVLGIWDDDGLSASGEHVCGRTASAAVLCWGVNSSGQLGNGVSAYYRTRPISALFTTSKTYTYGNSAHKHAVMSTGTGDDNYTYDENGNTLAPDASAGVTCRKENSVTYKQTYNAENRLASIVKMVNGDCDTGTPTDTWSFYYDGDDPSRPTATLPKSYKNILVVNLYYSTGFGEGGMFKQTVDPDGTTTIFIDGVYEEDRNSGGTITNTRVYYPVGGAMRVNGVVSYILKDNFGSAMATADASGAVTRRPPRS